MKKETIHPIFLLFLVLCACSRLSAAAPSGGWDKLNKRKGAEAKICVTVVDPDGKPLQGIPVKGYFYLYTQAKVNHDIAVTDADGRASVKGMCSSYNAAIELKKDGYYETGGRIDMLGNDYPGDNVVGVKNGKWIPYGIEKKYVFKQIRKPIPMVVFFGIMFSAPGLDREYGYDLEYGSFVEPYGDGKVADFNIRYHMDEKPDEKDGGKNLYFYMTIRFFREKDGAYSFPMDSTCRLKSPYHANPDAAYEKELNFSSVFHVKKNGISTRTAMPSMKPESQGLILRTRSVVSPDGTLVSAHYSKIYEEIAVSYGLEEKDLPCIGQWTGGVTTFYNPVENDTNLECDGIYHPELEKGKRRTDDDGVNGAL